MTIICNRWQFIIKELALELEECKLQILVSRQQINKRCSTLPSNAISIGGDIGDAVDTKEGDKYTLFMNMSMKLFYVQLLQSNIICAC